MHFTPSERLRRDLLLAVRAAERKNVLSCHSPGLHAKRVKQAACSASTATRLGAVSNNIIIDDLSTSVDINSTVVSKRIPLLTMRDYDNSPGSEL